MTIMEVMENRHRPRKRPPCVSLRTSMLISGKLPANEKPPSRSRVAIFIFWGGAWPGRTPHQRNRWWRGSSGSPLVEPRGVEPLSESNLERTSPGAVCYLHSLPGAGANTLPGSVASWCMVWAKLTIRTVSTQITPKPGSWTFRGGWVA